jgi:hypothetical protein
MHVFMLSKRRRKKEEKSPQPQVSGLLGVYLWYWENRSGFEYNGGISRHHAPVFEEFSVAM